MAIADAIKIGLKNKNFDQRCSQRLKRKRVFSKFDIGVASKGYFLLRDLITFRTGKLESLLPNNQKVNEGLKQHKWRLVLCESSLHNWQHGADSGTSAEEERKRLFA